MVEARGGGSNSEEDVIGTVDWWVRIEVKNSDTFATTTLRCEQFFLVALRLHERRDEWKWKGG